FEAKTPAQKPADLAGIVVDDQGNEVAQFRSEHEGRGRFEFTPQAGRTYSLQISEPSGIRTKYPLPEAKSEGIVLSAASEVAENGQPLTLRLAGTSDRSVTVTIKK